MTTIRLEDLKPFQLKAYSKLAEMVRAYPNDTYRARFDQDTGKRLPFLCRLRAITGSGKTPVLASTAAELKNGIILWTTNRSAVISQTMTNLRPGGKYSPLLPEGTQVFSLGDMSLSDWKDAMSAENGLTILLSTVAAFNQEGDHLKIHQKLGDTTRWQMLGGKDKNGRNRRLFVMYDEGHGATERQFRKLLELKPDSFILASASPLPEDLTDLLPGSNPKERQDSLELRTVAIPTPEVVQAGLLKSRLYLVDCNIAQSSAIREANDKWADLAKRLKPTGLTPIACFIVNDTERGVNIGEELLKLRIPAHKIAVHLDRARNVIAEHGETAHGLSDTYTGKKAEDRSPEILAKRGYTHIIWNLTLREGWDEPLAYVAYIDGKGRSQVDMVQKIGRFVRQPNATPFEDPDLNSAYFYFNVTDEGFQDLIKGIQKEMETEGYEVIPMNDGKSPPNSRAVKIRTPKTLTKMALSFGDSVDEMDQILLKRVPGFSEDSLKAQGNVTTTIFNMQTQTEDPEQRRSSPRSGNEVVTPWEFLTSRLGTIDSRILSEHGAFSGTLRDNERMRQQVQIGSEAALHLESQVEPLKRELNEKLTIRSLGKHGEYSVPPFNLISPNGQGGNATYQQRYRVHSFVNSLHEEYNGFNPFELQVAQELDKLGKPWARNPSRSHGYRIPINELGAANDWFYPDFLLWARNNFVWALDPKGAHIAESAIAHKLLDLTRIKGLNPSIHIAFILEGTYNVEQFLISKSGTDGFTLVRKVGAASKAEHFNTVESLVRKLTPRTGVRPAQNDRKGREAGTAGEQSGV